ncbi:hypothetical protein ABH926_003259 [Catenulispora sp. GP43]
MHDPKGHHRADFQDGRNANQYANPLMLLGYAPSAHGGHADTDQ